MRGSQPFALAVAVLCLVRGPIFAQPLEEPAFAERYDGFQLLFHDAGFALDNLANLQGGVRPSDWMLVFLGTMPALDPAQLDAFVRAGGTVLIATDESVRRPFANLPIRVEAGPIVVPDPDSVYRGQPACPIVRDWSESSPLFAGMNQLALNLPGSLRGVPRTHPHAAWLPEGAEEDGVRWVDPPAVIAGHEMGDGRVLVIADASLFANEMLLELDNLAFGNNCIEWLRNNREASRVRTIFLVNQQPLGQWLDPRFESGQWKPPIEDIVPLLNKLLTGLEDENVFNETLSRAQQRWRDDILRRLVLLAPGAILFLALCWWLLRSRAPRGFAPHPLAKR